MAGGGGLVEAMSTSREVPGKNANWAGRRHHRTNQPSIPAAAAVERADGIKRVAGLSQRRRGRADAATTMGQKRAVLVGINYPGTDGELKGCLNDVARMRRCLVDRFGFDEAGIRVLADADPSTPPPTGANIRRELERLVAGARAGDTLFFHYSGHGLQLPAETGDDECIVPCDGNLIKGTRGLPLLPCRSIRCFESTFFKMTLIFSYALQCRS